MICEPSESCSATPDHGGNSHELRARTPVAKPPKNRSKHCKRKKKRTLHETNFSVGKLEVLAHEISHRRQYLAIYVVKKIDKCENGESVVGVGGHLVFQGSIQTALPYLCLFGALHSSL